jgi:hypothetical protein
MGFEVVIGTNDPEQRVWAALRGRALAREDLLQDVSYPDRQRNLVPNSARPGISRRSYLAASRRVVGNDPVILGGDQSAGSSSPTVASSLSRSA